MSLVLRARRLLVPSIVLLASSGLVAESAKAGILVKSAGDCAIQPLSQPFAPWLDYSSYTPVANGGLESSSDGWSLSNAAVVDGNESFNVGDASDSHSLSIAPGGQATTSTICVGLAHPTVRFFAKRSGGGLLGPLSTLRVEVLFEDQLGLLSSLPIGLVAAGTSWQPTLPYAVVANLLPLLPGDLTPVAFRFTPQGSASWQIDDVNVDPRRGI